MADRDATVEFLLQLQIKNIDDDWVKQVWNDDFTDCEGLPADIEEDYQSNNYHITTLKAVPDILLPWIQGEETIPGEGFWSVLVENDLSYKNLIVLLANIMMNGQKLVATGIQKEAGIMAAGIYFSLLRIPGSGAFKIFHPILFESACQVFKFWKQLGAPKRKRTSISPVRSSQGNKRKGKARKRSKDIEPDRDAADPFAEDEEEDEEEEGILTTAEITKLQHASIKLLRIFVSFLSTYSLREHEQSAGLTLEILAELTKLEPELFHGNFADDVAIGRMKTAPELSYKGLSLLCTNLHGSPVAMLTTVFKNILSSLLMFIGENKVAAQGIPKPIQQIKQHAVAYVCHMMRTLSKESAMPAVRILLQHMCAKVPDKAEYRTKVAECLVVIMRELTASTYARMIEWFYKYSRNSKTSWRGFALDLVTLLLAEPERSDEDVAEELQVFLSHHFLLQMLLSRCSDVAPTVRSRAISSFGSCLASKVPTISAIVKEVMTPQVAQGRGPVTRVIPTPDATRTLQQIENRHSDITEVESRNKTIEMERHASNSPIVRALASASIYEAAQTPTAETPFLTLQLTPGLEITLSDGKGVTSMLRRRAGDEKVNVRKATLLALAGIVLLADEDINEQDLHILEERCRDPALSVRKQALLSLTSLLNEKSDNILIWNAWLNGVLPMVMDRETSAQEKCFEILEETILSNITASSRSNQDHHILAWNLLAKIATESQVELRRFLQKACQHWGKSGKLKANLITAIQSHVGTNNNAAVWMLLAEISPFVSKFDPSFVVEYWQQHCRNAEESEHFTVERVLIILANIAKYLTPETCKELSDDMKQRLMMFNSPPELVTVTVNALNKLCLAQAEDQEAVKAITDQWFRVLLQACDTYLSTVILSENPAESLDEDHIIRHLFTLGEIAQLCPAHTPKRVFMLVQSLVAAPVISSLDLSSQSVASSIISQTSSASEAASVPALTQSSQLSSQDVLSQFRGSKMSGRVRAHAFLTLGKLCLQNQDLAKKCVAALARELEVSTDPTIRNNVLVIMSDLCIRYTTLVDCYVSNISSCLKDESPLIRKQCLTLLTRLLQEDFLKWKGSLFYHFIFAIEDDVKEISEFAEYCLVHLLMQRHPAMFSHHFVECVFYFNSYESHSVYNKFPQTDREKKLFSLKGADKAANRMHLYKFMLEHMADEHRLQLTVKLCHDILAAVVDEVMPLDEESSALLGDALRILSSKEIKLISMRNKAQDDIADTEQDMEAVLVNAAKKTLITHVVKKNIMENVIPTVISLKHVLDKKHSPVLKDLMIYLSELMKDFKTEVKDILAGDRQLAKEIEFDLRKFEEQEKEQTLAAKNGMRTPRLPGHHRSAVSPRVSASTPPPPVGPNTPAGPRIIGTPRTPNVMATPRRPETPSSTRKNLENVMSTPSRQQPLSTATIINSAKKAIERAKTVSKTPQRSSGVQASPGNQKKVGFVSPNEGSVPSSIELEAAKTPKTGKGNLMSRAISTPSANLTMGNITFHQDQNITLIPPSPIPSSLRVRVYPEGPGTPSWSTRTVEEDGQKKQQDIINMFSPAKPLPKSRMWNVKSRNVKPRKTTEDSSPAETAQSNQKEPLAVAQNETVGEEKEKTGRRRSGRTRNTSKDEENLNSEIIKRRTRPSRSKSK